MFWGHWVQEGLRQEQWSTKVVNYISQLRAIDLLQFSVESHGKPFGTAYETQTLFFFMFLIPLVLLTTVWLWMYWILWEQEGRARKERACVNEPVCPVDTDVKNSLGSRPSWDKWSFCWERGTVPGFDVSALKDRRWATGRVITGVASSWMVDICGPRCCLRSCAFRMFSSWPSAVTVEWTISRNRLIRHKFVSVARLFTFCLWNPPVWNQTRVFCLEPLSKQKTLQLFQVLLNDMNIDLSRRLHPEQIIQSCKGQEKKGHVFRWISVI